MSRQGMARPRPRRTGRRAVVEILEGRSLPAGSTGIGFVTALGIGVTGSYSAIHSDAVATDAAGDTFITGSFRGTAGFDPNSSSATFTTANTQDAFVAKYGPTGSLIWARTFAGRAATNSGGFTTYAVSQGSAIAVDGSGNVFVAGAFSGTISLTGSSGVTQVSSVPSATEPYVAKLDPSGNVAWFDPVGGMAYDTDEAYALALDGAGGAVMAGSFQESATFGTTTLTAGGASEAFAARVNGSGQFLWAVATQGGSGSNAEIHGVAVDGSGNVDLAGVFSGTVDFNPATGAANLTSAGSNDATLWKIDAGGKFLWARSYGSTDYDAATAVAVDASGNLYATGPFSGTVNFGTGGQPDSLTAGPIYDTFALKVDPNGNEVWARGLVGPGGSSKGLGIAVDPSGTIHVAGTFSGLIDFDPGPGIDDLTSVGTSDAFVAGFDPTGHLIYALQAGQANFNAALGVAVNASGTVAITGTYSGSIVFGSKTLPAIGVASIYLARARMQTPPPLAPSAPVLEASSDTGISQADGITSVTSPVLDVNTADPSNTVELLRNGVVVAHRTGPGALADSGPIADGTYTYAAVQVSPDGVVGPSGPSTSITILTTAPAALAAPTLLPADDSGTIGDGITNVRQPRLSIIAKGATTIQILNAAGSVIGSAYASVDGTYLVSPSQPLADGIYAIRARAIDVAGNVGPAGSTLTLTIDGTPPAAPTGLALVAADDSGAPGDNLTNVRQPRLSGRAEPGSTVQVVDGSGKVYGSTVAAGDGTFTVRVPSPLADGSYVFRARAVDAAGNVGAAGPALTLTILATSPPSPSTPSLLPADVTGPAGGTLTSVRQPRVVGSAKAGTTVDVLSVSGSLLAVATAGPDGSYTAMVASPLGDGSVTVDAVSIDAAGNVSLASPVLTLTIDGTPPAAPTGLALVVADDSGAPGDNLTNVRQPRLSGRAEPGSTVQVVDGSGKVYGSSVVAGDGTFTARVASPLADGPYRFQARAIDAAGNVGLAGPALTLTILATPPSAPAAPALLSADDSGGPGLTSVRQPRGWPACRGGQRLGAAHLGVRSAVLGVVDHGGRRRVVRRQAGEQSAGRRDVCDPRRGRPTPPGT